MPGAHPQDDLALFALVKQGDQAAFGRLFDQYWDKLFGYVYNRLDEREQVEEIVQNVFVKLWERRDRISMDKSVSSFLFTSVKNEMLNYMRAQNVRKKYAADFTAFMMTQHDNSNEEAIMLADLEGLIEKSLSEIPSHYGEVYRMSRKEHIPTPEIAAKMNIAPKTVENYLSFALNHLRSALGGIIISWLVLVGCFFGS